MAVSCLLISIVSSDDMDFQVLDAVRISDEIRFSATIRHVWLLRRLDAAIGLLR